MQMRPKIVGIDASRTNEGIEVTPIVEYPSHRETPMDSEFDQPYQPSTSKRTAVNPLNTRVNQSARESQAPNRASRRSSNRNEPPTDEQLKAAALNAQKEATQKSYASEIKNFEKYCKEDLKLDKFSLSNMKQDLGKYVRQYIYSRKEGNAASSSLWVYYSAIKKYYTIELLRDQPWTFNSEKNEYTGNPCNHPHLKGMMRGFQRNQNPKNQSRAMHFQDLIKILNHIKTAEKLKPPYKAFISAYHSLAFFCWFRVSEVCHLQFKDIKLYKDDETGYEYYQIDLRERKTLDGLDAFERDIYEIHDTPDGLKVYTILKQWIDVYLGLMKAKEGQDDWYVFPALQGTKFKPREPYANHAAINQELNEFAVELNIVPKDGQKYSSHCHRRGGSQYAFFVLGWTLSQIKGWGGWTKGEGMRTILNYLVNEYELRENYIGDMHSPLRSEQKVSCLKNGNLSVNKSVFPVGSTEWALESDSDASGSLNSDLEELEEAEHQVIPQELLNGSTGLTGKGQIILQNQISQISRQVKGLKAESAETTKGVTEILRLLKRQKSDGDVVEIEEEVVPNQRPKRQKRDKGVKSITGVSVGQIKKVQDCIKLYSDGAEEFGMKPWKNMLSSDRADFKISGGSWQKVTRISIDYERYKNNNQGKRPFPSRQSNFAVDPGIDEDECIDEYVRSHGFDPATSYITKLDSKLKNENESAGAGVAQLSADREDEPDADD